MTQGVSTVKSVNITPNNVVNETDFDQHNPNGPGSRRNQFTDETMAKLTVQVLSLVSNALLKTARKFPNSEQ